MDKQKAIEYIESSFLHDLLLNDQVTDISFNGIDVYYVDNNLGRCKSSLIVTVQMVNDFIRQLANLSDKQFSYLTPNLDISIGKYRINAIHSSIARVGDEPAITFSLRIASLKVKINDKSDFFTDEIVSLLKVLIRSRVSLLIGGETGSGKTEFQKYLISLMNPNSRIIVVDNVLELENVRNPNIDISSWQIDEKNEQASASSLIKVALRNNPDWLILAEARGEEMVDVLNSAMTGLPIISTIHARSVLTMPERAIAMVMANDKKFEYQNIKRDVLMHFNFYIHLTKIKDGNGHIKRYVNSIMLVDENDNRTLIYEKTNSTNIYRKIDKKIAKSLLIYKSDVLFMKTFIGDNYE